MNDILNKIINFLRSLIDQIKSIPYNLYWYFINFFKLSFRDMYRVVRLCIIFIINSYIIYKLVPCLDRVYAAHKFFEVGAWWAQYDPGTIMDAFTYMYMLATCYPKRNILFFSFLNILVINQIKKIYKTGGKSFRDLISLFVKNRTKTESLKLFFIYLLDSVVPGISPLVMIIITRLLTFRFPISLSVGGVAGGSDGSSNPKKPDDSKLNESGLPGSTFFAMVKRVVINQWYEIKGGPVSGGTGVVRMEETPSSVKPELVNQAREGVEQTGQPHLAYEKDSGGLTKPASKKISICRDMSDTISKFISNSGLTDSEKATLEKFMQEKKDTIKCEDYDLKKK